VTAFLTYLLFGAIIVYCLVATYGDVKRLMSRAQKGWYKYRVVSRGRDYMLLGAAISAVFLLLTRHDLQALIVYVILAWLAGIIGGFLVARSSTRRWAHELQRQGSSPLQVPSQNTLNTTTIVFLLIALFVLAPLVPNQLPAALDRYAILICYGVSGFLLESGAHLWAWGKKKEKAESKPFEIIVLTKGS
jgi:hypothetical protein